MTFKHARSGMLLASGMLVGLMIGNQTGIVALAGSQECPAPLPTSGKVVLQLRGGGPGENKLESSSFKAAGAFTVRWSEVPTKKGDMDVHQFAVIVVGKTDVDNAVMETDSGPSAGSGTSVVRSVSCASGCSLDISSTDTNWRMQVEK